MRGTSSQGRPGRIGGIPARASRLSHGHRLIVDEVGRDDGFHCGNQPVGRITPAAQQTPGCRPGHARFSPEHLGIEAGGVGIGSDSVQRAIDEQHGTFSTLIYDRMSTLAVANADLLSGRKILRDRDNEAMPYQQIPPGDSDNNATDQLVRAALARVLEIHKARIPDPTHWARLAGMPESTARKLMRGKNTTVKTLRALAEPLGMSVGELLDYGEDDWERRLRIRNYFRSWSDGDLVALDQLLSRQAAPTPARKDPKSAV